MQKFLLEGILGRHAWGAIDTGLKNAVEMSKRDCFFPACGIGEKKRGVLGQMQD